MPTFIPDRAPTFDPVSQTWSWWSTPGKPSSLSDDQSHAELIEIDWMLDYTENGVKTWKGVVEPLSGFAPFLWNISHGYLWLRRPEGTWKAAIPRIRRKDVLIVQETCKGAPGVTYLRPTHCEVASDTGFWHQSASPINWSLEEWDRVHLGVGAFVGAYPVLVNDILQRALPNIDPYHPLMIPLWSRQGPMTFHQDRITLHDVEQDALVIRLANGVRLVHPFGMIVPDLDVNKAQFAVVLGDRHWKPWQVEPVIVDLAARI